MMREGETFASESMRPTLKALMQTHELRMLGFADLKGNVTNHNGEPRSNVLDRPYFYNIADGTSVRECEYLPTTKVANEPRVMFSIPAYDANDMLRFPRRFASR